MKKQTLNPLLIKIKVDNIKYLINTKEKTAQVIGLKSQKKKTIIIPRSINYKSNEYIISSIQKGAFTSICLLESIEFEPGSKVQTIEKGAFNRYSIKNFTIPSNLVNLEKGWFMGTPYLFNINVSKDNPNFILYDNQLLLGKSTPEKEEFDVLIFSKRDVKKVTIPKFIEIIGSYAFENCISLVDIEIPVDSKLRTIEEGAFSHTSIESLTFPSNLEELKEGWCQDLLSLKTIKIDPNNKNFTLFNNNLIIGKSSPEKENYDVLFLSFNNIEEVSIPKFIEKIDSFAFSRCKNLRKVEIPIDSKLKIIGKHAFAKTLIESIYIPPHVTTLCDSSFSFCSKLKKVKIPKNSELHTIENRCFIFAEIDKFTIPSKLKNFNAECFQYCNNLNKIKIMENNTNFLLYENKFILSKSSSEKEVFDVLIMSIKTIEEAVIPNFIEIIESCAFFKCNKLQTIKFTSDSKLRIIKEKAFAFSSIENIIFPSSLLKICKNAFHFCDKIKCAEFMPNSQLQIIEDGAFQNSSIERISMPFNLTHICDNAFYKCEKLTNVEILENSKLQIIGENAFTNTLIKSITIPKTVSLIGYQAFMLCKHLRKVEIAENSKIKNIGICAFGATSIESFTIPSNLINLEKGWCTDTPYLFNINVSKDNPNFILYDNQLLLGKSTPEKEEFDILIFSKRDVKKVTIPNFIEIIENSAFYDCKQLQSVDIAKDSKLRKIGNMAFFSTSISYISLPSHVISIGSCAFQLCNELKYVDIPYDSELQMIKEEAFMASSIKNFFCPKHLCVVSVDAFYQCNINIVEFPENYKWEYNDLSLVDSTHNGILMIPFISNENLINYLDSLDYSFYQ